MDKFCGLILLIRITEGGIGITFSDCFNSHISFISLRWRIWHDKWILPKRWYLIPASGQYFCSQVPWEKHDMNARKEGLLGWWVGVGWAGFGGHFFQLWNLLWPLAQIPADIIQSGDLDLRINHVKFSSCSIWCSQKL